MWVFLNDAFFSVVDEKAKISGKRNTGVADDDRLVVRARMRADLEKVFHGEKIIVDAGTDYRFRVIITREKLKQVMDAEIDRIDYGNFKDTTDTPKRHDAYLKVWQAMFALQSPLRRRGKGRRWDDAYLPF